MYTKVFRLSNRATGFMLAVVILVVSVCVTGINTSALTDDHTHNFVNKVYLADPSIGHIQTCTICGQTTGSVVEHKKSYTLAKCSDCNYKTTEVDLYDDTSYVTRLTVGEKQSNGRYSERYRYNLGGSGIIDSSSGTGNPYGQNSYVNGYDHGTFSQFNTLVGSGTESDPYVISDALTLFRIISSGSTNYGAPMYYKLGCDIDLGNVQWVDIEEHWFSAWWVVYKYKGFGGVLDGDGHTITGMFTNTSDDAAGFIPVLTSTGVVKNVHIRNSSSKSSLSGASVGVLVGEAQAGSQIIGCSVENCGNTPLVGRNYGTVKNSYAILQNGNSTYYNKNGVEVSADEIDVSADRDVWYKGGASGSLPRLANYAKSNTFADVNGDGVADTYDATDITALKSHLLWVSGYENVYGDVDRNGKTDMTDLAILQRQLADRYNEIADGFWRNAELGKFGIYYTDNDNYDFARKLELYLSEAVGVDVTKNKQVAPSRFAIVLKKDSSLATDYTISYDEEKAILTFSGKNFTAVEQAVLDFIENSDYKTSTVYETSNGTLAPEKQSITVNNKEYYYAWGDEFDSGSVVNGNTTVDYDKWYIRDMGSDNTVGSGDATWFRNLKFANPDGLAELNVVENGKLTMHRGINYGKNHVGEKTGYLTNIGGSSTFDDNDIATSGVLNTKCSMLFKRGYLEIKCTLPSDGFAFPAWWLMTTAGNNNPEISRSLYSKVYELNEDYEYAFYYTPDNYKTYKYKLPTASFEIDIFEIIQPPSVYSWYPSVAIPNHHNKYQYTIHKWYVHSKTVAGINPIKVYDLDWDNVKANGGFTQIFQATKTNGQYVKNWGILNCHTNNLKDGAVNANIINGDTNDKYNRDYLDEYYSPSNNQTSATFGFLWDEEQLTVYIYKNGSTTPAVKRVDVADLDYDGVGFDMEQYAYMLMENHLFTNANGKSAMPDNLQDCTMEVDYVRLYQLDGKRDIVTPETEAFNNPANRFQ